MEHTATPTRFYKARLTWNPAHGWEIALRDGTVYEFAAGLPGSLLTAIRDRRGNRLTMSRFGDHNVRIGRITSPNGRWVEFTWDPGGQWFITQVRDNVGRTVTYNYSRSSTLASVTDANGGVTSYTYNTNWQMLTVTDPRGITYLTNKPGNGSSRITSQTQADGTTYQFAYTVTGRGR
jgi:YD repeat-containing protein